MTRWLTGRRWLWIEVPKVPLPRTLHLAPFTATLYHTEMKSLRTSKSCLKCGEKGHIARECKQGSLDENKQGTTDSHENEEQRGNKSERNAKDAEEEMIDSSEGGEDLRKRRTSREELLRIHKVTAMKTKRMKVSNLKIVPQQLSSTKHPNRMLLSAMVEGKRKPSAASMNKKRTMNKDQTQLYQTFGKGTISSQTKRSAAVRVPEKEGNFGPKKPVR
ncbi:hypothetical protein ElyMa_004317100 [Elysia marginata]|uniref:CCHC-type domain-containing protein n=1 Tax=Elysia marginata TaxID=1093978 RepID=A0AAV4H0V0_9GAST|nr:hypothetical protein ElyMa_004317100 [Elysia marginata]